MAKRSTKGKKPVSTRSASPVGDVSEDYALASTDSEDAASIHSDALDEEEFADEEKIKTQKKRPRVASSSKRAQNSKHGPVPKSKRGGSEKGTPARKKRKVVEDAAEDEHESDVELKDGQEIVGKVVEAPKTGWGAYGVPFKDVLYDSRVIGQRPRVRYLSTCWISWCTCKTRNAMIASGAHIHSSDLSVPP